MIAVFSIILSIILALIPIAVIIAVIVVLVKLARKHLEYQEQQTELLREIRDEYKKGNESENE